MWRGAGQRLPSLRAPTAAPCCSTHGPPPRPGLTVPGQKHLAPQASSGCYCRKSHAPPRPAPPTWIHHEKPSSSTTMR